MITKEEGKEEATSGGEGQITGEGKNSFNKFSLLYEESLEKFRDMVLAIFL